MNAVRSVVAKGFKVPMGGHSEFRKPFIYMLHGITIRDIYRRTDLQAYPAEGEWQDATGVFYSV